MRQIPIELVRVSPICIAIGILPDRLERPPTRNRPRAAPVPRQYQWAGRRETLAVPRAGGPPVISTIYQRVAARLAMVRGHKVGDPADHGGCREPVTGGARWIVFDIEHAGEGDAVFRPATAMSKKVIGLGGTGGRGRASKVVATADEASFGGTSIVVRKGRVNVRRSFGGLAERVHLHVAQGWSG